MSLRHSMTRKCSAVFHFPREIVDQLTHDLVPLTEAGYYPLRVDIAVEVTGELGSSGALIPIKNLSEMILDSVARCPHLHDSVASLSCAFVAHFRERLEDWRGSEFSPDIELKNCTFTFEDGLTWMAETRELELKFPIRFQHLVDFDRSADGRLLKHGHHAVLQFVLNDEPEQVLWTKRSFSRFVKANILPFCDKTDFSKTDESMTGERIVQRIGQIIHQSEFREKIRAIHLKETEKNAFSLDFDRPLSEGHK